MLRRRLCIASPSSPQAIASLLCTSRRRYIQERYDVDSTIDAQSFLSRCGFKESDTPNRAELSDAFRRELARIQEGGAQFEHQGDQQHQHDRRIELHERKQPSGHKDNTTHTERVASLIEAYRKLADSRFHYLYDSSLDTAMSVQLGYKRSDMHFANYDDRRQEFFFSSASPRTDAQQSQRQQGAAAGEQNYNQSDMHEQPLTDFTQAFYRSSDLDYADMEAAIANKRSASAAPDPVSGGQQRLRSYQGSSLCHLLQLSFLEAFTGCTRDIVLQCREACRQCGGIGVKRKRLMRCGQCRGRGQLQLASGSDRAAGLAASVVTKQCSLCLGTGSTLPPDCGACRGTGLGSAMRDKRCQVHVPPGARDGDEIILAGAGNAGVRGGDSGDCTVNLIVRPHKIFNRDGDDLHVVVPVPLSVVLGGGKVRVPVLGDGGQPEFVSVDAPFGANATLSDRVILVSSLGMWRREDAGGGAANGGGAAANDRVVMSRGNLYVHCIGIVPKVNELTKAQRGVLVDHFFSVGGDGDGKQQQQHATISEDDFANAKELCRHWLP